MRHTHRAGEKIFIDYAGKEVPVVDPVQDIGISRGDGRYPKVMKDLDKTDLLILDDWGINPIKGDQLRDLLEVLEDRHGIRSTLVTSQLPVDSWHDYLGDPTLADAILDRLIHNAHRIPLQGDSMRKQRLSLTEAAGFHSIKLSRVASLRRRGLVQ